MMSRLVATAALGCALLVSGAAAQTGGQERYVVVANGERVGHIHATTTGNVVAIDYKVSNNGRGPTLRQQITLGAGGVPTAVRVEGTSTFGGAVNETFSQSGGRATWSSQAEEGARAVSAPALYIVNDDTPWSQGLYARVLLADPDRSVDVLPGGTLKLEEVRRIKFGAGARAIDAVVYRMVGLNFSPSYLLLDRDNRFLATVSTGNVAIREGYEDQERMLNELSQALSEERFAALAKKLERRADNAPVRIRNVRVFDSATGRVGPVSTVSFFGDTITTVEAGAHQPRPDGYDIDGGGGVLVPGLIDMHAHLSEQSALLNLAVGVTSVRDQGNDNAELARMAAEIDAGRLAGPRVVRNGFLEGRSEFSARNGIVADSLEEALDAVRWYADRGYYQIKIYNSLNPQWVAPVNAEARRLGMKVTGHIPAFVHPDTAIEAGYSDVAHINQLMLGWLIREGEDTRTAFRLTAMQRAADLNLNSAPVRRTVDLMVRNRVALDTTAITLENFMLSRTRQMSPSFTTVGDHLPIGAQRSRMRTVVPLSGAEEDARYKAGFEKLLQVMALLHRRGVQLLPGTDEGSGFSLHRELELYVRAGIPAGETLSLATLRAEQYLGRDQRLGSIQRGKLADFFLVPGDPTQDISQIRKVRLTVADGVIYLPPEIHAALGVRPFVEPVTIREPTQRRTRPGAPPTTSFSHEDDPLPH